MIITKYPDWVEAQLKLLDERIEEIYKTYAEIKVKPNEAMRIKENLYEYIKPFVDEKVRLIANSHPTYIVENKYEVCNGCCFDDGKVHEECIFCRKMQTESEK